MAHLALSGDFAMPNRADLMSLNTINKKQDQQQTTTAKFNTIRNTSNNLTTNDIAGKLASTRNTSYQRWQSFKDDCRLEGAIFESVSLYWAHLCKSRAPEALHASSSASFAHLTLR